MLYSFQHKILILGLDSGIREFLNFEILEFSKFIGSVTPDFPKYIPDFGSPEIPGRLKESENFGFLNLA